MTSPRDPGPLGRAADENLRVAFTLLAERAGLPVSGSRTIGTAVAAVTGSAFPFFNPIIVNDESAKAGDVEAAIDWVRSREVEPVLFVREDLDGDVAEVAVARGFQREDWLIPGMVLVSVPSSPTLPPELEVVQAAETGYEEWRAAAGAMADILSEAFARDPSVCFVFGRLDGLPKCQAIAVDGGGVTGIYSVGTSKDYRGRGYGRAITWAAIDAARRAWGERPVILQSSEMGAALYRSMGFVEICRYAIYAPLAETATGQG